MIERLKVNHFYTSPATIRLLMKAGDDFFREHELLSLKTIGSGKEIMYYTAYYMQLSIYINPLF